MYVRAISNISGMIFSSMVYSMVNLGWYTKYIVYNKSIDSFELIDYIDKTSSDGRTLIQIIQPQTDGFDEYGKRQNPNRYGIGISYLTGGCHYFPK